MRPLVHPALNRVWRDRSTVQIGLDPARAVVLSGLSAPEAAVLRAFDGSRDQSTLQALATDAGADAAAADRLLEILRAGGVLVDADQLPDDGGHTGPRAPDQACLGLLTGSPDGGTTAMAARRGHWVEVRGAGRVGASVARLLAAAGLGRTTVVDRASTTARDTCPGGLGPRHLGHQRGPATQRLVARAATAAAAPGEAAEPVQAEHPSLVVLAPPPGTVRVTAGELLRSGVPHLVARVVEVTGTVGPLVVPGRSSCLRCLDLHRTDRDPAWPRVVAQSGHQRLEVAACDVTLAALVAGLTAQQALAYLDGFQPAALDGTIETSLPDGLPRRRSWTPHPACGCTWS
ncbi:MAG TPA: hypothetical protein VK925_08300 [Jiangellaceae bacterium]|nr:hypothetical protein [Jiangellaceae bacterium]